MTDDAPKTFEDAIKQGFSEISAEEFQNALSKYRGSPDLSIEAAPFAEHPCADKPDGFKWHEEFKLDGEIYVGICFGHTCKYLSK